MFDGLLPGLIDDPASVVEKDKGVAFLVASRQIYQLLGISYFCLNIPKRNSFVHCSFSDCSASQAITPHSIDTGKLTSHSVLGRLRGQDGDGAPSGQLIDEPVGRIQRVYFRLDSRNKEMAFFGYLRDLTSEDELLSEFNAAEVTVLANYFHSHILRRHGNDTSEALLVSARELDCLKWAAAGKSAWEASIILGISERTVRFHLNSAREKLNCTTTTQAVAKVVAQNLISI